MRRFWSTVFMACLLCQLERRFVCAQQTLSDWEEELGVDMCPECRPLPSLVHTLSPGNFHEEDLGVDMCPEKGQPMAGGGKHASQILAMDSNSMVKELQQLMKVQKLQIDQLGDLLQQLGKNRPRGNLGVLDSSKEETRTSRDSYTRSLKDDEFSEPRRKEDVAFLDLAETTETQSSIGSGGDGDTASRHGESAHLESGEGHGSGAGGMTVVPYRPSWPEHFSFLSAVKVDGEVSCLCVLPDGGDGGATRYVVGDMNGELYIFLWRGDLLLHHRTISTAPITAMLSYSLLKTEIILITGHADGGVLVHQISVNTEQGSFLKDGMTSFASMKTLHSLKPPSPYSFRANVEGKNNGEGGIEVSMHSRDTSASIVNLETFKVGKMTYTIVVDTSGKIYLFRDNGSLHGVAQSPSRPLAFMRNPNGQRLIFLTEKGVGTLDLRSMQVRSSVCADLNTSLITSYAFDTVGRSKANGFTTEGDLVSVVLRGDMLNFECHVKKKHQLEIAGPFAALALRGYLVAATPHHVLVFNTTSQTGFNYANLWVAGPRLIISVTMNEIALSFLKAPIPPSDRPVVVSNRDRFIVLGLGGGHVGVFRSNLPVKPADVSAKFSNISFFMSVLVLFAMWQLLNRKKSPAAVVNSEYPSVLSSSTSADGKAQSARLSLGEREKVVEPRRFKSPTRGYVVGNPKPFGSTSRNFNVPSVDSDSYISARREPLFASNQPVGELKPRE